MDADPGKIEQLRQAGIPNYEAGIMSLSAGMPPGEALGKPAMYDIPPRYTNTAIDTERPDPRLVERGRLLRALEIHQNACLAALVEGGS